PTRTRPKGPSPNARAATDDTTTASRMSAGSPGPSSTIRNFAGTRSSSSYGHTRNVRPARDRDRRALPRLPKETRLSWAAGADRRYRAAVAHETSGSPDRVPAAAAALYAAVTQLDPRFLVRVSRVGAARLP